MSIRVSWILILVAAGLIGLAGCSTSNQVGDLAAADTPDKASGGDTTGVDQAIT